MACFTLITKRLNDDISIKSDLSTPKINVNTTLICSLNIQKQYIRIEPEYLWLTEDNNFSDIVNVFSDIQWNVI